MESSFFSVRSGNPKSGFEIPPGWAEVVGGQPAASRGPDDAQSPKAAERSNGTPYVVLDSGQLTPRINDLSAGPILGDVLTIGLSGVGAEQDPRLQPATVSTPDSAYSQDGEQPDPTDVIMLPDDRDILGYGLRCRCTGRYRSGNDTDLFREKSHLFYPQRREDALQNKWTIDSQPSYQPSCVSCRIRRRLLDKLQPLYGRKIQLKCTETGNGVFKELGSGNLWNVFVDRESHPLIPSGLPQGSVVSSDTGSAEAVAWVRSRLADCLRSRSSLCGGGLQSTTFVPTRLIYLAPLGRGGDVVLLEGQDVPAGSAYVALSHCWGGKIPDCTTTRQTLADRKRGITWKSIPRTFRDAMEFTLKLGLEYIWIDSVCIIQQDPSDWLREAGRMYHVYKNAYITVGAVYAEDCSGGLFSGRDECLQLKLLTLGVKDHRYQLYARRCFGDIKLPVDALDDNPRQISYAAPLFRRAWTFQEWMVTPRSVFFMHGELIWDCYHYHLCECRDHHSIYRPSKSQTGIHGSPYS